MSVWATVDSEVDSLYIYDLGRQVRAKTIEHGYVYHWVILGYIGPIIDMVDATR